MTTVKPKLAVIDTNVMLDWLVFSNPAALQLGTAVLAGHWAWHRSPPMLEELQAVLRRPLPERWEAARKHALTIDIDSIGTEWRIPDALPAAHSLVCRDAADQMFIDLALCCGPAWLVTRDRALLALRRRAALRGVVIVTPEQWLLLPEASARPAPSS